MGNRVRALNALHKSLKLNPLAKVYPLCEKAPETLVVCCADPRFLEATHEFLRDIGEPNPIVIAIPGSIKSIGMKHLIPKQWHTLKHQLELLAQRNSSVSRVVLFAHEDCKSYAASAHKLGGSANIPNAQRKHLIALASFMKRRLLPEAKFELYRATIIKTNLGPPLDRAVRFENLF